MAEIVEKLFIFCLCRNDKHAVCFFSDSAIVMLFIVAKIHIKLTEYLFVIILTYQRVSHHSENTSFLIKRVN